jgi:F0F1-type ATP synthase membrane subunit b/b'
MLLLASGGEWMEWFNYPGLELWKFLNLAIFLAAAIYILRKKINEALLARRDAIQQEALARVAEADDLLSRVDEHVGAIHKQAAQEAEAERNRLAQATTNEKDKLKQQALREIESANKLARKELRKFLAKRSVELARASVEKQIRPEDDTLLIKESIGDLRRTTV